MLTKTVTPKWLVPEAEVAEVLARIMVNNPGFTKAECANELQRLVIHELKGDDQAIREFCKVLDRIVRQ